MEEDVNVDVINNEIQILKAWKEMLSGLFFVSCEL